MNEFIALPESDYTTVEITATPTSTQYRGKGSLPSDLPFPVEMTVEQQGDRITVKCSGDADRAALVLSTALDRFEKAQPPAHRNLTAMGIGAILMGVAVVLFSAAIAGLHSATQTPSPMEQTNGNHEPHL
jgi:hypothetical protein